MYVCEFQVSWRESQGYHVDSPEDIYTKLLKDRFDPIQEHFYLLPRFNYEVDIVELFCGGLEAATVDLRTLFSRLLVQFPNCSQFVVAHNHPNGDMSFSSQDLQVTKHIIEASKVLGYKFLDHIIFDGLRYKSYLEAYGDWNGR